jgi:hypothetical protein
MKPVNGLPEKKGRQKFDMKDRDEDGNFITESGE